MTRSFGHSAGLKIILVVTPRQPAIPGQIPQSGEHGSASQEVVVGDKLASSETE
jgi:hypothetical protein